MSSHTGRGEKPLHVRVAEALGLPNIACRTRLSMDNALVQEVEPGTVGAFGLPAGWTWGHDSWLPNNPMAVPRYDADWSATGPLIEQYRVWLQPCDHNDTPEHWTAMCALDDFESSDTEGPTPLIAACRLILALHAAGKLPAHPSKQGDEE